VALLALVSSILFGIGGATVGWSSDHGGADDPNIQNGQYFCEADQEGSLVRQPAGAASSLFFFLASFCIAILSFKAIQKQGLDLSSSSSADVTAIDFANLMNTTSFFPGLYVLCVALIGTGSMALHTTLKRWGAIIDVISVVGYVVILLLHALARWLDGQGHSALTKPRWFFVTLLSFGIVLGAFSFAIDSLVDDTLLLCVVFFPICIAFLLLEVLIYLRQDKCFQIRWFVASLGLFGIGATFNALSGNDGILCASSTSWFQGHAMWHAFTALATVTNYLYLASEHIRNERHEINEEDAGPVSSSEAYNFGIPCKDCSGTQLFSLEGVDDRIIEYSMAGILPGKDCLQNDVKPVSVLVFHPLNANRRLLLALHEPAVKAGLTLICISRPLENSNFAQQYMRHVLEDAVCVLDSLGIAQVSLLAFCAGTPYALAFASTKTERTNGKIMMISPWVSPADYNADPTVPYSVITSFQPLRLILPRFLQHYLLSCLLRSVNPQRGQRRGKSKPSITKRIWRAMIPGGLSKQEKHEYRKQENLDIILATRQWMEEEDTRELVDIEVGFSHSSQLDILYEKVSENSDALIWFGEKDALNYVQGVKWLARNIASELRIVKDGTHDGVNLGMILYGEMQESLDFLRRTHHDVEAYEGIGEGTMDSHNVLCN